MNRILPGWSDMTHFQKSVSLLQLLEDFATHLSRMSMEQRNFVHLLEPIGIIQWAAVHAELSEREVRWNEVT